MSTRSVPADIRILEGTDVASAWERFEIFEALHHAMRICNPMTTADLDLVLGGVAPRQAETMLDIACGHGELLIRAADRVAIRGVGIDLSPWCVVRAHAASAARTLQGSIEWRLGDAHELSTDERFDVVTCLGASWIWHGFAGAVRAQAKRALPGARIAVGDLRLRAGVDPAHIAETYGKVLNLEEQQAVLEAAGVAVIGRIDAGDDGWDGYQERIAESARSWARRQPGEAAQRYLAQQHEWRIHHDRDREFLEWTVWIGRVR